MDKFILQLTTKPALKLEDDMTKFRKELIKVGSYIHPSTEETFEVTMDTLNNWVANFDRYLANGSKVPIPLGHWRDDMPEGNAGWVTAMNVEGESLYAIMELIDPDLALTTDVSVCIEADVMDCKKNKYKSAITHVALTTHPVIVGLEGFKKLSLSLVGDPEMEFMKKVAEKLGLKAPDVTEEAVLLAIEPVKPGEKTQIVDESDKVDPLVKLVSENRAMKLSNMVKAGLITPAVKDVITAKYVDHKVLALSMEGKNEDGFDVLYEVLMQNRPVKLEELSGVQSIELSNQSDQPKNAMEQHIDKKRKAAGLDN